MKELKNRDSISLEFFSKEIEIEKYARIGRIAHELFHDLLNPITGFFLYMNLPAKNFNQKELTKHHKQIQKSIQRINNFIKLIRESIVDNNKEEEIILEEEIREIMLLLYYKAKRNKISTVLISESNFKFKVQKIKMYQIFINLLSNAIDSYEPIFDGRKKRIVIKTKETNHDLIISFRDNGCGIDNKNLDKIFNLNYTDKDNGFGIGLKTVKKIVENDLGGKIDVKSISGKGTTFEIKIPKKITAKNRL